MSDLFLYARKADKMNDVEQPVSDPIINQRKLFSITFGLLVLFLFVGGGIYYISSNKSKTVSQNDPNSPSLSDTWNNQTPSTLPFNSRQQQNSVNEKFKLIIDGKEIYINKNNFDNPDKAVMDSIESYDVSPDKSKIAILGQSNISTYFLFLSDAIGENIVFLGFADEVEWSHNSKHLAFTSPVTDIGPHRFSIYEIESRMIIKLEDKQGNNPTKYSNLQWNEDDKSISADYYSYKIPGGEETKSGKKTFLLTQFK